MNIECRFNRECNRFQTDDCAVCLHNRRRNAPKCYFDRANDEDLNDVARTENGMCFATKIVDRRTIYKCPACGEVLYTYENDETGRPFCVSCDYCGLPVVTRY